MESWTHTACSLPGLLQEATGQSSGELPHTEGKVLVGAGGSQAPPGMHTSPQPQQVARAYPLHQEISQILEKQ